MSIAVSVPSEDSSIKKMCLFISSTGQKNSLNRKLAILFSTEMFSCPELAVVSLCEKYIIKKEFFPN